MKRYMLFVLFSIVSTHAMYQTESSKKIKAAATKIQAKREKKQAKLLKRIEEMTEDNSAIRSYCKQHPDDSDAQIYHRYCAQVAQHLQYNDTQADVEDAIASVPATKEEKIFILTGSNGKEFQECSYSNDVGFDAWQAMYMPVRMRLFFSTIHDERSHSSPGCCG